jgi:Mn2+/Fe2+ NRAMP family transporter
MAIMLSLGDAIWVLFAIAARAPAGELLRSTFIPSVPASGITGSLIFLVIAIVGTTIAPWQLFFQQSCIADKRLRYSNLFAARLDTFTGAVFTIVVAGAFVLIPRAPLQLIIVGVQVLAGIILPVALVFLQILLNDKQVMGQNVNKPWQNAINWIIIGVLFVMSAALMLQSLFPKLFPA